MKIDQAKVFSGNGRKLIARVFINFMKTDQAEVVNDNGRKLPKVPRSIATVFINFVVFTSIGKRSLVFSMARVLRNGKRIRRLTQAEVVNDSGRELPEVPPKHCDSVH